MRRGWIIATLVGLLIATVGYRERQTELRNQEARQFIESLIPKLQAYKAENGRYPDAIPTAWLSSRPFPVLLGADFYLAFDDGQEFLMRFRDPRADPRFWYNDIVAYQSNIGHRAQWDGY